MSGVIIVGGGMAGATLALMLSRLTQGTMSISLIEAMRPDTLQHPGFDARVIALSHGTCEQLKRVGLWSALSDCATAIEQVHVSDQGHAGFTSLDRRDYKVSALGQVVELHQVGQRLFQRLETAPGVRLYCPASVRSVTRTDECAEVILDSGEVLHADLLVAADGSDSPLAQACGLHWRVEDYAQIAVIANVTTSQPHRGQAFERFTAQGPLALLPMSKGRSSLVWCHSSLRLAEVEAWDEATFREQLQQAFGWRLGHIQQVGERHVYPLLLRQAQQHISHRLALVGNAAQTLHPIAGQGFNLGIRDVLTLAETVAQAHTCQVDIGRYSVLRTYAQRRGPDQARTIALTDGLVHLFANDLLPMVVGRNLGLRMMELIPALRAPLAQRTLGWVER